MNNTIIDKLLKILSDYQDSPIERAVKAAELIELATAERILEEKVRYEKRRYQKRKELELSHAFKRA